MSRKDYEAIAAVINRTIKALPQPGSPLSSHLGRLTARHIAEGIAEYMTEDNPRFTDAQFLAACGLGS